MTPPFGRQAPPAQGQQPQPPSQVQPQGVPQDDGTGLAPGDPGMPVDPASLPGVEVTYFAIKIGGESGKAVGLFRVADDDDAEVLTLERFTTDGEWEDDPGLIDELHQPGCYAVDENEAQSIQSQILAGASATQ